jgi:hypothetical protein
VSHILSPGSQSNVILGNYYSFAANGTAGTISHLEEVYSCNRGWLAALVIASALMLIAGGGGTTLKYKTVGPDVLGYVSSLTRDNPHMGGAEWSGSSMDGLARAKELRGVRIRLEDAREKDEVGHIVVAALSGRGETSKRLRKGRLYI